MSFSKDLWGGFDIILANFNHRRKGLKELSYILGEQINSNMEYGKNLFSIYDFNFCNEIEGSLQKCIDDYKNGLLNTHNLIKNNYETIQNTVINPMREFATDQIQESRLKYSYVNSLNSEFKTNLIELQSSKLAYHNLAKAVEDQKVNLELIKTNNQIKQEHKQKLQIALSSTVLNLKVAEENYIKTLNECNYFRDSFVSRLEEIYDFYQKMELEYNQFLKAKLIAFHSEMLNFSKSIQEQSTKSLELLKDGDPEKDVLIMIEKYSTNFLPPNKLEFVTYTSNVDKNSFLKSTEINNNKNYVISKVLSNSNNSSSIIINNVPLLELVNNVKTFCKSTFVSEIPDCLNTPESKIFSEIRSFLKIIWDGKALDEDDQTQYKLIIGYIKDKRNRKYLLSSLNKFRISGLFLLDKVSYDNIVELIKKILDFSYLEKDYESIKFCIILSQTFYKIINNVSSFLNIKEDTKNNNDLNQIHKSSFSNQSLQSSSQVPSLTKDLSNSKMSSTINNIRNSLCLGKANDPFISPKQYIQVGIQNHECFSQIEIWKGVIKYSIKDELSQKSGQNSSETNQNQITNTEYFNNHEMLKNIAFGQLLSVGYNMMTFGISKETVFNLLKSYVKQYELESEMEAIILSHMEDFSVELVDSLKDSICSNSLVNVAVIEESTDILKEKTETSHNSLKMQLSINMTTDEGFLQNASSDYDDKNTYQNKKSESDEEELTLVENVKDSNLKGSFKQTHISQSEKELEFQDDRLEEKDKI